MVGGTAALNAPRFAAFKLPEALVVVDELPTTAPSKVAKNLVRDLIADTVDMERLW